jgi:hypothetical protein
MQRFIELTYKEDRARVLVSVAHILHVAQRSDGTRVYLRDDAFIDVGEDLDEVRRRLEAQAARD